MRRSGQKPAIVFIDADSGPEALPQWLQWQHVNDRLCDIDLEPGERLSRIDWRPVVGLTVHVSGLTESRVRAIAQAVEQAGASRVISVFQRQIGAGEWIAFQTVWQHDTQEQEADAHSAD